MKQATICPFCKKDFPLTKNICACGAYRVEEETINLPLKRQPYMRLKNEKE